MKDIIEKLNEYAYKGEIVSTVESLKLQFFLGNISLYKITLKTRTFNSLMRKGCRTLGDAFKWNGSYNKIVNFDIECFEDLNRYAKVLGIHMVYDEDK